jgi:CDGSH-type Zn-finger protein
MATIFYRRDMEVTDMADRVTADRVIAQKGPYAINLKPGDYFWCACGRSKNQPFCDSSHKGTGFTPTKFTMTDERTENLCGCKHTATAPYCNGTHMNFM